MSRTTRTTPTGLVQIVHLSWGKSARGGEGARLRNAQPRALAVPDESLAEAGGLICVETIRRGLWLEAARSSSIVRSRVAMESGFEYADVGVTAHDAGLLVRYRYGQGEPGWPDRWYLKHETSPVSLVKPGEWMSIRYNSRHSDRDDGGWRYEEVSVNVALFETTPDGRIFVDRKPSGEWNFLARLR